MQSNKFILFFFKQGQLTFKGMVVMMTLGAAITYASLAYLPLSWMQNIGVCLGLALIVIASLATRAGVLGFKPFTNDPLGWRAAKKTYQDDVKDKES